MPTDTCPHCGERLNVVSTEQNDMGTKVNFVCRTNECIDTIDKVFFAYVSDLQY